MAFLCRFFDGELTDYAGDPGYDLMASFSSVWDILALKPDYCSWGVEDIAMIVVDLIV